MNCTDQGLILVVTIGCAVLLANGIFFFSALSQIARSLEKIAANSREQVLADAIRRKQ